MEMDHGLIDVMARYGPQTWMSVSVKDLKPNHSPSVAQEAGGSLDRVGGSMGYRAVANVLSKECTRQDSLPSVSG